MKYSINFYLDELKPKVHYLTLKNVVIASIAIGFVMLIWSVLLHQELANRKAQVAKLQQQVDLAQANLIELQSALVKHNDQATFNNQRNLLAKKLEAKEMLWEGVGKRLQSTTVNYYSVMKELSEHHDHDLWLSEFNFNEDNAVFNGFALNSSSVTKWMTYLQSSSSFKGREFSHLNVKAVDETVLSFQVATSLDLVTPEGVTINE